MISHSQFLATTRFQVLDGLRALSILAVIWHHTAPPWVNDAMASFGAHGVSLFFAISGFLITTLLLRERDRNGSVDLKAFYIRRTLRIFPLYFGTLFAYIVLVYFFEKNATVANGFWGNLIYFLTYTSNIFVPLDGRVIFYFAWSLAVEEQFYLIWPSILLLVKTTRTAFYFLLVLVLVLVLGSIVAQIEGAKYLSSFPLAIVAGALLAMALRLPASFQICRAVLGQKWSSITLVVATASALIYMPSHVYVVQLCLVGLVGACVLTEQSALSKILKLAPLAYIGSISYGMYMLHMLCKGVIVKGLDALHYPEVGFSLFLLTLVASMMVAHLSYLYYESYFIKIKNKFIR